MDLLDDNVGIGSPDDEFRVLVGVDNEAIVSSSKVDNAVEDAALGAGLVGLAASRRWPREDCGNIVASVVPGSPR